MENIVISDQLFNGYYVKYPYGTHRSFIATSHQALIDGLIMHKKHSYRPEVFAIETFHKKPKFRKLTGANLKNVFSDIYK
jgi:hypothetical protein